LPARQFVQDGEVWRERVVGLDTSGNLAFGLDASEADPTTLPPAPSGAGGAMAEVQSGLGGLVETLSARAAKGEAFRALFIDYGPAGGTPGDTLRAYCNGEQVHPLAAPGETDLTVDVDFARLARLAAAGGLDVAGPTPQGQFLGALGLQTRLDHLVKASPADAEALFAGAQKLVDPSEMGTRFRAICLSSQGLGQPAGF
ncbi:MAG: SAM-dependent methyltransferase, partial [Pseudomonadota bacterium]